MNTKHMLFILFVILAQALAACGSPAIPIIETTSVPTSVPAPTATPEPADPAEVVQAFWDAMAVGDMDAAMAFVAEDVKCRGSCYLTGKDSLRAYLQGMVDSGSVTKISDLVVDGDTVTYFFKVLRNDIVIDESKEGESMQILNGKIIFWKGLHI